MRVRRAQRVGDELAEGAEAEDVDGLRRVGGGEGHGAEADAGDVAVGAVVGGRGERGETVGEHVISTWFIVNGWKGSRLVETCSRSYVGVWWVDRDTKNRDVVWPWKLPETKNCDRAMNYHNPLLRTLRHASRARIHARRPPARPLSSTKTPLSRLHKFNERRTPRPIHSGPRTYLAAVPRFLRRYTTPLLAAPVSHVTAFLVLHELTAVVPLVALAAAFHWGGWLPLADSEAARRAVDKWSRYARRKGWLRDGDGPPPTEGGGDAPSASRAGGGAGARWRVVLEVASAWAVVKVLMPVRIVGCVWATPWFAARLVAGSRLLGRFAWRR